MKLCLRACGSKFSEYRSQLLASQKYLIIQKSTGTKRIYRKIWSTEWYGEITVFGLSTEMIANTFKVRTYLTGAEVIKMESK